MPSSPTRVRALPASLALLALLVAALVSSPASSAAPATRITGFTPPSSAAVAAPVEVTVRVTGPRRPVELQRRTGDRWQPVARARTRAAGGAATLRWTTPVEPGTVTLRVHAPRAGKAPAASTPASRVDVVAAEPEPEPEPEPETSDVRLRDRVFALVNEARAQGQTCGGERFPPAGPLARDAQLERAADDYAQVMADRSHFDHTGPDGSTPGQRVTAAGYRWRAVGENIAAGYATPEDVVAGWLSSTGHCRNIMGGYADIGIGYGFDAGSRYGHYWVQNFGTRQ